MDIPTYEQFFKKQGMQNPNRITGMSNTSPTINPGKLDLSIGTGDIDVAKIDFTKLNQQVVDNPNGFSQNITTASTYTDVTGCYLNTLFKRNKTVQLQANVGFVLTQSGGAGNVYFQFVIDGVAQTGATNDYGNVATSGVGFQSTRSLQHITTLPFGRHKIKIQAKYVTTAGTPNLNVNSFHMVYIPLGN